MKKISLTSILLTILFLQACGGKDEAPREFIRHNTQSGSSVPAKYEADTTCKKGEGDCNFCANDVQKQFHDAVLHKLKWSTNSWAFGWTQNYDPDNATPKSVFGSPTKGFLGIRAAVKHVQGFVRTNSDTYPYAGSHSHTDQGGIFIIKRTSSGLALTTLHLTDGAHPSGVQILGKYLVYGSGSNLVFKNLESADQNIDIKLSIEKSTFGGGLGLVRLVNDNYLVITTGPGGENNVSKKRHQFYDLSFTGNEPSQLDYISEDKISIPSGWSSKYRLSENLSVISECVTGDIYAVNVSGSTNAGLFNGSGYWKLSKLESKNNKLTLKAINYYKRSQNISSCNSRATGTISVNELNELEFYCHEHGKDINKKATKYRFQKGTF